MFDPPFHHKCFHVNNFVKFTYNNAFYNRMLLSSLVL